MTDWNGEGLPPIGAKCEMIQSGGECEPWGTWIRAEILARADGYIFCRVLVGGDASYPEMIREDRYTFRAINPVDPRMGVLDELFTMGEMFYQQRFAGCDAPPTLAKYREDAIKNALRKLDNLPPF